MARSRRPGAPPGIEEAKIEPATAGWRPDLGEFVLPYEAMRRADDPRAALLEFLESTYRMHPKVCEFVSDVAYQGRLHPAPGEGLEKLTLPLTARQRLSRQYERWPRLARYRR
jgi:hypothetical protein